MKIIKSGYLSLLMIVGIILFASCNNDDESVISESLNGIWNVKNISGGFAGIDDEYDTGIITWTFNNQTLTVENNDTQNNVYSGFESGTFNYSTTEINGISYIFINDDEFGSFAISNMNLTINQNETTAGVGADGFILQFQK